LKGKKARNAKGPETKERGCSLITKKGTRVASGGKEPYAPFS